MHVAVTLHQAPIARLKACMQAELHSTQTALKELRVLIQAD